MREVEREMGSRNLVVKVVVADGIESRGRLRSLDQEDDQLLHAGNQGRHFVPSVAT